MLTADYLIYLYVLVFVSSAWLLLAPRKHPLKTSSVVVITGGVQGLGLALAKVIASRSKDLTLVIVDIREDLAPKARKCECESLKRCSGTDQGQEGQGRIRAVRHKCRGIG